MTLKKIVILSNDVIPEQQIPCSGPGIRAHGLALGLRDNGYHVTVVVPKHKTLRQWHKNIPPPTPANTIVIPLSKFSDFISSTQPDIVIFSPVYTQHIKKIKNVLYIADFFAPKLIESSSIGDSFGYSAEFERFRTNKINTFKFVDACLVNGSKKLPYYYAWAISAGINVNKLPMILTYTMLPPLQNNKRQAPAVLQLGFAGYTLPWMNYGEWTNRIHKLLDEKLIRLHLFTGNVINTSHNKITTDDLDKLKDHANTITHAPMSFDEYVSKLNNLDIFIDVCERSIERELSLSTRGVTAISCGTPLIHNNSTELSGLIGKYDAGWLVDYDNTNALEVIINKIQSNPDQLKAKRNGARKLAMEIFCPKKAIRPLVNYLNSVFDSDKPSYK